MKQEIHQRYQQVNTLLWEAHGALAKARWERNIKQVDAATIDLEAPTAALRAVLQGDLVSSLLHSMKDVDDQELTESLTLLASANDQMFVDTTPEIVASLEDIDNIEMEMIYHIHRARKENKPESSSSIRNIHQKYFSRMEAKLLQLFRMRNQAANQLGYPDYATLVLQQIGTCPNDFIQWLKLYLTSSPGIPKHLDKPEPEQAALSIINATTSKLNQPGIEELIETFVSRTKLNLNDLIEHIYIGSTAVSAEFVIISPNDRRLMFQKHVGYLAMINTLHELGHAYGAASRQTNSFAKLTLIPPALDEGLATAFEYFGTQPEWLQEWTALSDVNTIRLASAFDDHRRIRCYLLAARAGFEISLYTDQICDPQGHYVEWLKQTGLSFEAPTEHLWAVEGHGFYTENPVYRQNYVCADLLATIAQKKVETLPFLDRPAALVHHFSDLEYKTGFGKTLFKELEVGL